MNLEQLLDKCITSGDLTRAEIITLLSLESEGDVQRLLDAGDAVRREYCGDDVHIRGLIEFSNCCSRKCNYCGLRAQNPNVKRYRIPLDEIVALAVELANQGMRTVVLQSGEDPYYTGEMIADIVRRIKSQADIAITLSAGERDFADYKLWKEAGADRYLSRHETANPEHYRFMHPDSDLQHRLECANELKKLGFQVGIGCMVGSPGQTIDTMADDIELMRDFQPDMVGIGPFIANEDTPFADYPSGSVQTTLKMVALARIVTRNALLPATTAIGSIDEYGRELALKAGADVVMPNYTPLEYRIHYEIYPNKRCITEDPKLCAGCLKGRITSVGRTVSSGHGHTRKK